MKTDRIGTRRKSTAQRYSASVRQYLAASLATNTRRGYQADVALFMAWGGRIPATPRRVAAYLAHYAPLLASSTLSRRLVAIAWAHTSQGFASPTHSPLVKATLQGIRRTCGRTVRQVAALQKSQVLRMVQELRGMRGLRDRALLLLGFAGALRRSELVALNVDNVQFNEEGMVLHLRRSKTDQAGLGRDIAIPRVRGRYCPCRCLSDWLKVSGITAGAVFRPVNRYEQVLPHRLSAQSVALVIKRHTLRVGLDPALYAGHSLRAGFVTNAVQRGASAASICAQTGHRSDAMMQRYVRAGQMFRDNANLRIWKC